MQWKDLAVGMLLMGGMCASAQQAARTGDPVVDMVSSYVGRALFLRCFCADNNLTFNVQGQPASPGKVTDWTLAGVNLQKVERKGPEMLQLEGVRVAIKYVPDRKEFERHPQNEEKIRISLPAAADARQMDEEMAKVFAVGIDLPLQQAMPPYWRHYFDAKLEWPKDEFSGQNVYAFLGPQAKTSTAVPPSVDHKADAGYTPAAEKDRVKGTVQLRMVVNANGQAKRVAVAQPLGYGLDERAVEAVEKFRFHPATDAGKPVPAVVLLQQEFVLVPLPPH